MKAIEFHTTAHDGVITLPNQYWDWQGKHIRVILLEEEQEEAPVTSKEYHQFKALRLNTRGFHFDREKANELTQLSQFKIHSDPSLKEHLK